MKPRGAGTRLSILDGGQGGKNLPIKSEREKESNQGETTISGSLFEEGEERESFVTSWEGKKKKRGGKREMKIVKDDVDASSKKEERDFSCEKKRKKKKGGGRDNGGKGNDANKKLLPREGVGWKKGKEPFRFSKLNEKKKKGEGKSSRKKKGKTRRGGGKTCLPAGGGKGERFFLFQKGKRKKRKEGSRVLLEGERGKKGEGGPR